MTQQDPPQQPTLHFFRSVPKDMMFHDPLASSLQSFETCLFMISMGRFPAALVICGSAIESVLRAKLKVPRNKIIGNRDLFDECGYRRSKRKEFCDFFETRNGIIHHGFMPSDSEISAKLLLETGFPLLSDYYIGLFDFYLDWKDLKVALPLNSKDDPEKSVKNGLDSDVSDVWQISKEVYQCVKDLPGQDFIYCFKPLIIRLRQKLNWKTESAMDAEGDGVYGQWEFDHQHRRKKELADLFGNESYTFDCPVCISGGGDSLVVELDKEKLSQKKVGFQSAECVNCGFEVGDSGNEPLLLDILLKNQLAICQEKILQDMKPWWDESA